MKITLQELEEILKFKVEDKTVSFQKGDTVFVTQTCHLNTMPLRAYLKTFGAKQVHDINKANYVIGRNLDYNRFTTYEFKAGTFYDKKLQAYVHKNETIRYSQYDREDYANRYENVFNYDDNNKIVFNAVINNNIPEDFYLKNRDVVFLDEDFIQGLVLAYHKSNTLEKIDPASLDKIVKLITHEDNSMVDLGISYIKRYNLDEIMKHLILYYHSNHLSLYAKKRIRSNIFEKDPKLYKIIDAPTSYGHYNRGNKTLTYPFYDQNNVPQAFKHLITPDDIKSFLS